MVINLLVVKCASNPSRTPVTWQIKYLPFSSFNIDESNVKVEPVPTCLPFTGTEGSELAAVNQVTRSVSTGVRQFQPSHLAVIPVLSVEP